MSEREQIDFDVKYFAEKALDAIGSDGDKMLH
jgi:hypothetical protein